MTELTYVKFTENNDHEGETWTFWLQLDGNEERLAELAERLGQDDEEYQLDLSTQLSDSEAQVLAEHGGTGYMAYHHKVAGRMSPPDSIDDLYKGGIRDLFA